MLSAQNIWQVLGAFAGLRYALHCTKKDTLSLGNPPKRLVL
jgi:hypothetical protein